MPAPISGRPERVVGIEALHQVRRRVIDGSAQQHGLGFYRGDAQHIQDVCGLFFPWVVGAMRVRVAVGAALGRWTIERGRVAPPLGLAGVIGERRGAVSADAPKYGGPRLSGAHAQR